MDTVINYALFLIKTIIVCTLLLAVAVIGLLNIIPTTRTVHLLNEQGQIVTSMSYTEGEDHITFQP